MKILLAAALLSTAASAAPPCALSDADRQALAASPAKLDAAAAAALPAAKQALICDTRAFLRQIDAQNGRVEKVGSYSPRYLSPDENARVTAAVDEFINRALAAKGIGGA
jgi:hypothetical protein